MTLVHSDDWLSIHQGDCREVMAGMEPESVNCVVTSPPYWGLRDYGVHGQLGLEKTPDAYVASMVDVFRAVRRVLRPEGTLWLNLGDSYAAARGGTHQPAETLAGGRHGKTVDGERVNRGRVDSYSPSRNAGAIGLKHKDLVGIPWRVAFALQADGWYLRMDVIWSKPNPMPESVTDRPTKAHEYVFLLAKSERYYYDAASVAEATTTDRDPSRKANAYGTGRDAPKRRPSVERGGFSGKTEAMPGRNAFRAMTETRNLRSVWTVSTAPYPGAHFAVFPERLVEPPIKSGCPEGGVVLDPFAGSGTVGRVANRLSRRAVLIDLNAEYIQQQFSRNRAVPLGLTEGDAA